MSLSWAFTGILALKYAYNSRRWREENGNFQNRKFTEGKYMHGTLPMDARGVAAQRRKLKSPRKFGVGKKG